MNFLINPSIFPLYQILISFTLCLGILNFGEKINKTFFKDHNYSFFNFAIGAISLSQLIFIFYLLQILDLIILPLTLLILFLGILEYNILKKIEFPFKKLIKINKNSSIIIIIFFLIFFIISLGPPSMTDALDYHYGVPLNIIENSSFPNQEVWLHGSLFGLGEIINIIPLYLKTDNFFAFFQIVSLVLFFEYLYKRNIELNYLIFAILFVICSPVILFIISGPKALLFPQLLTTMSLFLYVKETRYNRKNIIFISILLLGATQFKLSFILSSLIIGLLIIYKTFNHDKKNIINLILLFSLFFFPKLYYNFTQVYPFNFLNFLTTSPKFFLDYLSNFKDNYLFFPINLFIPTSLGKLSTILGFHIFLILFLKRYSKEIYLILIITFLTIIFHYFFGQQSSRIYFEFILWISLVFYFLKNDFFNLKYYVYFLYPQLIFIFISSLYFAIMIFPTFFDLEKRDAFMKKNTSDYLGIKWINKNIPENAVIISELRSISLFENKTIPLEKLNIEYGNKENYVNYLKLHKPKFFVTKSNNLKDFFLRGCLGEIYKISEKFENARRNPFNRKDKYKIYIYHLNYENLNYCVDFNK